MNNAFDGNGNPMKEEYQLGHCTMILTNTLNRRVEMAKDDGRTEAFEICKSIVESYVKDETIKGLLIDKIIDGLEGCRF